MVSADDHRSYTRGGMKDEEALGEKPSTRDPRLPPSPIVDNTLDEDLNRERLEPGQNAQGTGGAGARPSSPKGGENSNT